MRWTDEIQLPWLESWIVGYINARDESKEALKVFLNKLYEAFTSNFALDDIVFDKPIGKKGDSADVILAKRQAAIRAVSHHHSQMHDLTHREPQRLAHWMDNHTRDTASKGGGVKLNLLQPEGRRPQAINAYAELFNEQKKLEDDVTQFYNQYLTSLPPGAPAKRRVTIRGEVLRMLLAKEDQITKDEVDAYRNRPKPGPWTQGLPEDATEEQKEKARLLYWQSLVTIPLCMIIN